MACKTCGHTMQSLGLGGLAQRTFWCPRCGSLLTEIYAAQDPRPRILDTAVAAPTLVGRARRLAEVVHEQAVRANAGHEPDSDAILRELATVRESVGLSPQPE